MPFGRWTWVADIVPLPLVEIATFSGAILGVALMIVARGLQQRLAAGYHLAVGMLGAGVMVALLREFDVEEALIVATMLGNVDSVPAILLSTRVAGQRAVYDRLDHRDGSGAGRNDLGRTVRRQRDRLFARPVVADVARG